MIDTIVGAGARAGARTESRYGSGYGSDQMMRLLSAPAPQHCLIRRCGIYNAMLPDYEAAAKSLKDSGSPIKFAKVSTVKYSIYISQF
jgi:hypothetical protein